METSTREELRDTVVRRLIKWHGSREPLVCDIAEGIAADLIFGTLAPGAELNSVDLAARFHVSRTPVREALMLLAQEGLVVVSARKRARVASPSEAEVREIYGLRGHLLALMVRELVASVTGEQLEALGECVGRLDASVAAGDVDGYFRCHVEFQDMMTEFAGNRTLKQVLDSLALRTLVLRHVSASSPGRMYVGAKEQRQLMDAIASRDADLAAAVIAHSTRQALATVERAWAGRPVTAAEEEDASDEDDADPADAADAPDTDGDGDDAGRGE
ncbi:MAG TPA: GntR family transcriptional regulator [Streptosporangiaceae bacterium]|jgi:DNA-binding GntR family transcriptional regulator|nr:GntR family transcriptional regulator [Streptosporangiaceae bacterium]